MDYEEEYYKQVYGSLVQDSDYYNLASKISFNSYFKEIKDINTKKILEFGCGLGKNIFLIRMLNVQGYDISKFAKKFTGARGIKTLKSEKEIKDNNFDIILSCHNLEHMNNPLENLEFLRKKIKKKGLLLLIVPKEAQTMATRTPDMVNYHLYSWNFRTINNLLHKAGFEVLLNRVNYIGGPYLFKFLSKMSFKLYLLSIRLLGRIRNTGELFIIARKTG